MEVRIEAVVLGPVTMAAAREDPDGRLSDTAIQDLLAAWNRNKNIAKSNEPIDEPTLLQSSAELG